MEDEINTFILDNTLSNKDVKYTRVSNAFAISGQAYALATSCLGDLFVLVLGRTKHADSPQVPGNPMIASAVRGQTAVLGKNVAMIQNQSISLDNKTWYKLVTYLSIESMVVAVADPTRAGLMPLTFASDTHAARETVRSLRNKVTVQLEGRCGNVTSEFRALREAVAGDRIEVIAGLENDIRRLEHAGASTCSKDIEKNLLVRQLALDEIHRCKQREYLLQIKQLNDACELHRSSASNLENARTLIGARV